MKKHTTMKKYKPPAAESQNEMQRMQTKGRKESEGNYFSTP